MKTPHCLVFDSGMGGLTVVSELEKQGFSGRVSYAADTGFFPYGNKSDAELTRRIPAIARGLIDAAAPDNFVIACNTASTLALQVVRAVIDIPVVGTVPAIKPAALRTQTGTIGVLATPGTLRRAYTDALIHEFAREKRVLTHGSVELVEMAERFAAGEPVSDAELKSVLDQLILQPGGDEIDIIVLACTHFPLLRERLSALLPAGVQLVDSGEAIARRVLSLLPDNAIKAEAGKVARGALYTTGASPSMERLVAASGRFGFADFKTINPTDWL
ncbi:glutamate racemase [Ponticaulis sp.]|uniref:glutamate racemase n=1 Tax=Ponticaulis sp. TaxID=2020902 RepID=UPI0026351228|nr:glutamate racemase [Ponticaulis sp.]MDF1680224.1 glutamate racemase [Ponticaulis sp.]